MGNKMGAKSRVLTSSLLFAILFISGFDIIPLFLGGIICQFEYFKNPALIAPILCHFSYVAVFSIRTFTNQQSKAKFQ